MINRYIFIFSIIFTLGKKLCDLHIANPDHVAFQNGIFSNRFFPITCQLGLTHKGKNLLLWSIEANSFFYELTLTDKEEKNGKVASPESVLIHFIMG